MVRRGKSGCSQRRTIHFIPLFLFSLYRFYSSIRCQHSCRFICVHWPPNLFFSSSCMLCKIVIYHNLCCADAQTGKSFNKSSTLNEFRSIFMCVCVFFYSKIVCLPKKHQVQCKYLHLNCKHAMGN